MSVQGYRYGRVPEDLLHSAASDRACRLHALLTRWADTKPGQHPTREELAGLLRCSTDSVDRAVKELEAGRFLKVKPQYADDGQKVRAANDYILVEGGRTDAAGGSRKAAATRTSANGKAAGNGSRTGAARGGRTGAAAIEEVDRTQRQENESAPTARDDVQALCDRLAEHLIENGGNASLYRRKAKTKAWHEPIRLLLDRDLERDAEGNASPMAERVTRVERAIDWCQADDFWHRQILSTENLREKFERLRLAAKPSANGQRNGNGRPKETSVDHDDRVAKTLRDLDSAPPLAGASPEEWAAYYARFETGQVPV